MAIYTTFFLCEPPELPAAFPAWKLPLPQPVSRTRVDPFTGEEMTVETRAPEWEDMDPNNMPMPEMDVVPVKGDYETFLQERIPQFVQSKPHWCAKDLTSVELGPLVTATTGPEERPLETALFAHPFSSAGIEQFPNGFVAHLQAADESALNAISEKWAAEMSTPDYTHSVSGERIQDDMTVDEALSVVRPLAQLAKKQQDAQTMYLLTEA